jgi:hypothetical protein
LFVEAKLEFFPLVAPMKHTWQQTSYLSKFILEFVEWTPIFLVPSISFEVLQAAEVISASEDEDIA